MPSLKYKAWADANGDWVVYIGHNCEWEHVNVYTRHRVPLPKISDCPKVEHTGILRRFKYDHGDYHLRKIAICRVPNRSWVIGMLVLSLSSTSLLPSFIIRLD